MPSNTVWVLEERGILHEDVASSGVFHTLAAGKRAVAERLNRRNLTWTNSSPGVYFLVTETTNLTLRRHTTGKLRSVIYGSAL